MLKLGTVFSGIGAVEHALERLNIPYEIQFACDNGERKLKAKYEEIEEITKGMNNSERNAYITQFYNQTGVNYVEQTYKANFQIPDERFFQDAKLLDGTEFCGNVDLFVGGSPCQSFSVMGKRKGLEEARGTLFYEYARLVQEVQPKVFIYENVTGMLNHDKGRTWKIISEIFDSLEYKWTYWVLNAKDFNLPQNRRRIFVVGFRKDLVEFAEKLAEPKKMKLDHFMTDLLEQDVPNKYYLPEKGFKRVVDPNQIKHVALNGTIARCQVACQQYNWFGDMRFEETIPERLETDDIDEERVVDHDFDERIENGSNVLLYGVPGSGKSWTIEHEYCKKESRVERLVFHPDYTYSDFIGQILPVVAADGQVSYEFTPGPFTNILKAAYTHPMLEYILVIEEINRGNAPAIFGEVFQLLDRKVERSDINDDGYPIGTSEYGITNANIAKIVYGNPNHKVRIPSNLSIIGTMNTSDQNVFTLDTAFQRRWEMRLIENNFENVDVKLAKAEILDTGVTWEVFCTEINDIIVGNNVRMSSSEDKRLGAYFVRLMDLQKDARMGDLRAYDELRKKESAGILSDSEVHRIAEIREAMKKNRRFPEKVIKYLWDDAFKFNREVIFETTEFRSLESVIRAFMYSEGIERFKMFKQNIVDALQNPDSE